MKSQINQNRVGSCIWFVVVVAISLSFSGCCTCPPLEEFKRSEEKPPEQPPPPDLANVSNMALSDDIIARVGGIEVMKGADFFVSNVITMRRGEIKQEYMVFEGKVVRTSDIYAENVRIEPKNVGKTQDHEEMAIPPYGYQLNIVFDQVAGHLAIPFVKKGSGANEKYEISFTDDVAKRIDFDGIPYYVSYGGEDRNEQPPYLLFKIEDKVTSSTR